MADMFRFGGKTVLVTGGTSGIGRAVARAFTEAGATVIAAGLPCSEPPPDVHRIVTLNVKDENAIAGLSRELTTLDVLVNAAGVIRRDDEFDPRIFADVIDINLTGAMRMCMATRPLLTQTKGCIVNVASMLTFFGGPRVPAYSASKGGIGQLTRSLAVAWAKDGIRVNAVAPGWIATPLTQALQEDPDRSAQLLGRVAMTRWGRPEEIAGPILFLCSEQASFMTGAIVPVDGGYSAA